MATKKEKKSKTSKKQIKKTYVAIVLDRSGSMSSIHNATVDGINAQILALREAGKLGGETEVALIQFDDIVETVFAGKKPTELKEWAYNEFQPRGYTAMYDGIWNAINYLKTRERGENTAFLVCVISDGGENASKEVTQQVISDEIKRLQESGEWTFTYMLANQDIHQISTTLHVNQNNIASYNATLGGATAAGFANSSSIRSYMGSRSAGLTAVNAFYSDAQIQTLADTK